MSSTAQPFWARLPFGRRREDAQVLAVEDATLRSDRFRIAREGEWRRLEAIVGRIEKGRLRKLSDEDLLALPALYRTLASSLAVARETSLDAATIAYLEALAQRAWFIVYGPRASLGAWFVRFIGGGWGEAVRFITGQLTPHTRVKSTRKTNCCRDREGMGGLLSRSSLPPS